MSPKRFEAKDVDPSALGQPLTFDFSGLTVKNRFMKAAMTECLSSWDPKVFEKRGVPTPALANVYRRWGEGGWGVILTGNVMIEYDHIEAPGNAIIPIDASFEGERFEAFKELAAAGKKDGSLLMVQVSHPGRQVYESMQKNPISASDVQLDPRMGQTFAKPRPMEAKDIERVVEGFAHAAEYAHKAGFDGIQLQGAHGYLLAQFLSSTTNKRTDAYGGSLLNRARIILEIADAIKARTPSKGFSLGIKINSVEFQEGGFSPEDCADLVVELENHGFDYIELSGGTYQELAFEHKRESSKQREAFFLDFADSIVPRLTKTKAYVVGGLRTVSAMVEALKTVHGVSLGRPGAHELDFPKKVLEGGVKSAIETKLPEQDFGITNLAAGAQIRLVSQDKQPIDLSQDNHAGAFFKAVEKWMGQMSDNADGSKYGPVEIEGVALQPYGTPYL